MIGVRSPGVFLTVKREARARVLNLMGSNGSREYRALAGIIEKGKPRMAEIRRDSRDAALSDSSVAELLKQLSEQTATLVHQELVYGAIAGALALTGNTRVRQGVSPMPEQTVASVTEDVQWTRQRAREARQ